MPGHKRNINMAADSGSFGDAISSMYSIDITEIDGFDNLHDAKDLIQDAQNRAAKLYKSDETHFLVNGATCGILAAVAAVSEKGKRIIVARNCHNSVYNAIEINNLTPVYVYPDMLSDCGIGSEIAGSIRKEEIEKAVIANPDACGILITSPTYDGVLSDIAGIAKIAHEYDIPLIVDEAHGALFFMEGRSAVIGTADIVINSVHKTLPALTQTALLHVNGKLVDRKKLRKYLSVYQTSSPSYVLMGSIDYAVELMEEKGKSLYREFCLRIYRLKEELSKLRNIKYISKDTLINQGAFDFDESKVLIAAINEKINGKKLYSILRDTYKLQPEMAAGDYVLLMTTLFDSDEGINRLIEALFEIDCNIESYAVNKEAENCSKNEIETEYKEILNNIGKNSPYTVFAYPPGIPIIVKNERVTEEVVSEIRNAKDKNLDIKWIG